MMGGFEERKSIRENGSHFEFTKKWKSCQRNIPLIPFLTRKDLLWGQRYGTFCPCCCIWHTLCCIRNQQRVSTVSLKQVGHLDRSERSCNPHRYGISLPLSPVSKRLHSVSFMDTTPANVKNRPGRAGLEIRDGRRLHEHEG
jgi:hypothetical protein